MFPLLTSAVALAAPPTWTPLPDPGAAGFHVAEVALDQTRACARAADGRVACWGEYVAVDTLGWAGPTSVPLLLDGVTDAVDIAVGSDLYVARADGTVWKVREDMVQVEGLRDVVQLERAANGVCARSRDGSVACHGWIPWLEAADSRARPLHIEGTSLACGVRGCCAWAAEGALSCVGDDDDLGFGKRPGRPAGAPRSGVDAVSIGPSTVCARSGGRHHCWGDALPDGFDPPDGATLALDDDEPCWVSGGTLRCLDRGGEPWTLEGVEAVVRSEATDCALGTAGALSCWGDGEHGELADGLPLVRTPVEVPGLRATALSAARDSTCAVRAPEGSQSARMWCWGSGDGRPTDVASAPDRFGSGQYAAGCGLWGTDAACVGRGWNGTWTREPLPSRASIALAVDRGPNVCTVDAEGRLACLFTLGEGGTADGWRTVAVPEPVTSVAPLSLGVVALGRSGAVYQWTDDRFDGDPDFVAAPKGRVRAKPVGVEGATLVAAHQNGGCAVTAAGLTCWGGLGFMARAVPLAPAFAGATSLDANHWHVCGVVGGRVLCLGATDSGALGRSFPDEQEMSAEPVEVPLPGPARAVAVGAEHGCALLEDQRVFCWGSDVRGQLGQGRVVEASRPVPSVFGAARVP